MSFYLSEEIGTSTDGPMISIAVNEAVSKQFEIYAKAIIEKKEVRQRHRRQTKMMIDSVDESGLLRTWMNETWHLTIHRAYDYVWLPPNTPDDGREKCLIQIRNNRAGERAWLGIWKSLFWFIFQSIKFTLMHANDHQQQSQFVLQ